MKKKIRARQPLPPSAPPIVRRLIASFTVLSNPKGVDVAYRRAQTIINLDSQRDEGQSVDMWVTRVAEQQLLKESPALREDDSDYRMFAGSIQCAFQEPSFNLGFVLAFLLFSGKGGAR